MATKTIKSTDVRETRKDRENFRKGWDRIFGKKKGPVQWVVPHYEDRKK